MMSERREHCLPEELVEAARRVVEENRARGLRIAVAESCTGGLVSAALTEIPGSSDVFEAGWVTYANESKVGLLGVSQDVLETFGAVSVAVAWGMAQAAIKRSNADVSVAITGIAGPGGGSPEKPVGLVHFALATEGRATRHLERRYGNLGREAVRRSAVADALGLLEDAGA